MSADKKEFNFKHEEIDVCLKQLGKELKKEYGRGANFELVIVGGAAIACNYQFRQMTNDIDALSSQTIKSAVYRVADQYGLPNDWLNTDFSKTESYSPKLRLHSKHYRNFAGVLEVRSVQDEYLVAMKLRAFRRYKHDMSDIVGIIKEANDNGHALSKENISNAFQELYGSGLSDEANKLLDQIFGSKDLNSMYLEYTNIESCNKDIILEAENDYKNSVLAGHLDDILKKRSEKMAEETEIVKKLRLEILERYRNEPWFRNVYLRNNSQIPDLALEVAIRTNIPEEEIHIDVMKLSIWIEKNGQKFEPQDINNSSSSTAEAVKTIKRDIDDQLILHSCDKQLNQVYQYAVAQLGYR